MKHRDLKINFNLIPISIFFLWYLLPIMRYYFQNNLANITMILLIGIWLLIVFIRLKNKKVFFLKYLLFVIILILIYVFNMIFRASQGNIGDFIKMGIMFWFPAFVFYFYYLLEDKKSIKQLIILVIVCLIATAIPTIIELFKDSSSLRWMAYYASDRLDSQIIKGKSNIGDYTFIYGIIFMIPIIFYYMSKKNNNKKLINYLFLGIILFLIVKASFSIAIFMSFVIIVMCIYSISLFKKTIPKIVLTILGILVIAIVTLFPKVLIDFSYHVENEFVSSRIREIANVFIESSEVEGDLSSRLVLYNRSLNTFKNNVLFGIGGYYYVENVGIGYHSQLLDDMARYGIISLISIILFLIYYKEFLTSLSAGNKMIKSIAVIEIIAYIILMIVNPIYQSAWISTIFLCILPSIIFLEKGNEYEKSS